MEEIAFIAFSHFRDGKDTDERIKEVWDSMDAKMKATWLELAEKIQKYIVEECL